MRFHDDLPQPGNFFTQRNLRRIALVALGVWCCAGFRVSADDQTETKKQPRRVMVINWNVPLGTTSKATITADLGEILQEKGRTTERFVQVDALIERFEQIR